MDRHVTPLAVKLQTELRDVKQRIAELDEALHAVQEALYVESKMLRVLSEVGEQEKSFTTKQSRLRLRHVRNCRRRNGSGCLTTVGGILKSRTYVLQRTRDVLARHSEFEPLIANAETLISSKKLATKLHDSLTFVTQMLQLVKQDVRETKKGVEFGKNLVKEIRAVQATTRKTSIRQVMLAEHLQTELVTLEHDCEQLKDLAELKKVLMRFHKDLLKTRRAIARNGGALGKL
jgi:DNA-binding FrmR family transcriptional regulator